MEWQYELPLQFPFVFSDDFDCLKCGACCVEAGVVFVYPDEKIAARTKPLRQRFAKHYPDLKMRELDRHCEGRCKSLKGVVGKNASCGVYENRPRVCRQFEPRSEGCISSRQDADSCIRSKRWERRGYGDSWEHTVTDFPANAKRVQHVKRGSTYQVVGQIIAEKTLKEGDKIQMKSGGIRAALKTTPIYIDIQCSLRDIKVTDVIVVYRCEETQKYWGRLLEDFNTPGRFKILEQ